jgi:DNA-directed RNA polymerase subunit M
LKFCQKCGAFCQINSIERHYVCSKCEWQEPLEESRIINRKKKNEKIIVISEKEKDLNTMPKTKAVCQKCGNQEAYWWMVQTRGIDESMTQFYRCTKCGHTWRDYS